MKQTWITQVLEWLEKNAPTLLAVFGLGYKAGAQGKQKVEAELKKTELQLKLKENELENEKYFGSRSSDDVIDEFLGDGVGPKKSTPEDKG